MLASITFCWFSERPECGRSRCRLASPMVLSALGQNFQHGTDCPMREQYVLDGLFVFAISQRNSSSVAIGFSTVQDRFAFCVWRI